MSAFTTDYLRGIAHINGGLRDVRYINNPKDNNTHTIQVNSKFFSPTHSLKDGWDDRGNNHSNNKNTLLS